MERFNGSHSYNEERSIVSSILEIAGLSEEDMIKHDLYTFELKIHGFGFDTLLGLLMNKYNYSKTIYNFFRGEGFKTRLERIKNVKEYLLELKNGSSEVVDRVADIVQ